MVGSVSMVREGDATLTVWMSYYRGACGLEEHVGHMDIREGEAGMAPMVSELAKQQEKS